MSQTGGHMMTDASVTTTGDTPPIRLLRNDRQAYVCKTCDLGVVPAVSSTLPHRLTPRLVKDSLRSALHHRDGVELRLHTLGRSQHSQRPFAQPQSVSANHSMRSELQESQQPGHTDPLSLSVFTPQLLRMYPPAECIKDYITEGDMEDIIECYSGQALVKEELSKAELEVQGV